MKSLGDSYESAAIAVLQRAGLRIVDRNYRCKAGEVDIIASDGGLLVFVEVRARRAGRYGSAAATVDLRKQRKLYATAQHFLQSRRASARVPCRFDVITFEPRQSGAAATPRWIKSAFTG